MKRIRGQATVEAALGSILLAATLVFGIHFGEIGFVSLKVQEAAAAGLWESTGSGYLVGNGYKHHFPRLDPEAFDQTPALVAQTSADVQNRYQDMNGLSSVAGSTTQTGLLAQISGMSVSCQTNAANPYGPGVAFGGYGGGMISSVYDDNGGLSCSAQATITATTLVPTLIELAAIPTITVCSSGRAWGGTCQSKYLMMLDDWGAEASSESGTCDLVANPVWQPPCAVGGNTRFYDAAANMYNVSSGFSGANAAPLSSAWASLVVGWSAISSAWPLGGQDENHFFMSVTGEPVFTQVAPPLFTATDALSRHYRLGGYGTTPGATIPISYEVTSFTSYLSRTECFLGQPCN